MDKVQHRLDGGRLAGAVAADEPGDPPRRKREGYAVEREPTIRFRQAPNGYDIHLISSESFDSCEYRNVWLRPSPPTALDEFQ
jgi:hypothetical protein